MRKSTAFYWAEFVVLSVILLAASPARAQHGIKVISAANHDVSPPLRSLLPAQSPLQPSVQQLSGSMTGFSFAGLQDSSNWTVPDANGAVGATQFVQWVNLSFAVYDKSSGALLLGPTAGQTLWSGFGGPCQTANNGDPIAQYDKAAGRWVMTQRAIGNGTYLQCLAVSTTSDATGSYNRYSFVLPNMFPDYPKLGVWRDGYYLSINELNPTTYAFSNAYVCALDRNSILLGAPATAQCFALSTANGFSSLLPADLDGTTLPPAGSPEYFMTFSGSSLLRLWKFHVDFVSPHNSTFTGPVSISVPTFSKGCNGGVCIPQLGTAQRLDSLGDRLMYRLAYRNFGDHESLVANHTVNAGSSVGLRWYEIRNPAGTPALFQEGTYAPDSSYRWMASVAMDKDGDMAMGYSVSSSAVNPAIRFTGRLSGDTLGTLRAEGSIIQGSGSETSSGRWGDYTSLSVDPTDDCTFWYTSEYLPANGSRNWNTQIASFKFPSCQ